MTFTRRTYRIAINLSIARERDLRIELLRIDIESPEWIETHKDLRAQNTHTARLKRRKRRERK